MTFPRWPVFGDPILKTVPYKGVGNIRSGVRYSAVVPHGNGDEKNNAAIPPLAQIMQLPGTTFIHFCRDGSLIMTVKLKHYFAVVICMTLLAGCQHVTSGYMAETEQAVPQPSLMAVKEVLDATAETIPTLTAIGYAVVSNQPGQSNAQKRLMAIRAARMAAMRDLAEQIHGLKVDGSTTVIDLMVQNDTFRGVVSGTIRGARTVRINPTGSDTYEIVLEIDRDIVTRLMSAARTYS